MIDKPTDWEELEAAHKRLMEMRRTIPLFMREPGEFVEAIDKAMAAIDRRLRRMTQ